MSDLTQVYDALMRIERNQGEFKSGIDNLAASLKKHVEDDDKVEERVSKIERHQSKLKGIAIAAGAVVSVVISAGVELLKGHH